MILPVYIPDWQIGDGDIQPPHIGMSLTHVLLFRTDDHGAWRKHDPELSRLVGKDESYGKFGQEVTITGVAEYLADHHQQAPGTVPTAIHCEGFVLYWDAPTMTEGSVTLTGIIDATDYGAAPEGFPEVNGVVDSMELSSLLYSNEDGGGVNWAPTPGHDQQFRPVSTYPGYVPESGNTTSPHWETTGVVVHLDTQTSGDSDRQVAADASLPAADAPNGEDPSADGRLSGADGPIRIRVFPDYAGTVLWLHGPVDYADAALSPELAADMAEWESAYYDALDGNEAWKSRSAAAQFTTIGNSLARRLAQELGEGFEVAFHSYAPGSSRQLFHSEKHSRNPAAAKAFHGIVVAEEALQAKFEADQGDGVGWFAYAPSSGTVFDPGKNLPPGFNPEAGSNP